MISILAHSQNGHAVLGVELATFILELAGWWLIFGAFVAVVFLLIGVDRIDEDARGAYAFRPLMIPGILLIWPLVLWRWMRLETGTDKWAARYRPPRNVHLPVSVILAIWLGFAVIAGFAVRQSWPDQIAPVLLEEPGS